MARNNIKVDQMNISNIVERVVSAKERRQRSLHMKKQKMRLQKARERMKLRIAPEKTIKRRAQKVAKQILRKRFAGEKGVEYGSLAPADKIVVDRLVDKKVKLIRKIAQRLIPRIKRLEVQRLAAARANRAALNGRSLGNIPFTTVSEIKTARTPLDHLRARSAQLSRRESKDKKDAAEYPTKEQGLPSAKLPKQLTPASKKPHNFLTLSHEQTGRPITESFNIAQPSGYGVFLTAKDIGINIKGGFALHPDVEEELERRKKDD